MKFHQFPLNAESTDFQQLRTIMEISGRRFGESWVRIPPARSIYKSTTFSPMIGARSRSATVKVMQMTGC